MSPTPFFVHMNPFSYPKFFSILCVCLNSSATLAFSFVYLDCYNLLERLLLPIKHRSFISRFQYFILACNSSITKFFCE